MSPQAPPKDPRKRKNVEPAAGNLQDELQPADEKVLLEGKSFMPAPGEIELPPLEPTPPPKSEPAPENPPPGEQIAPPGDRQEPPSDQERIQKLLANLRLVRTELQDLTTILASVRAGQVELKTFASFVTTTRDEVKPLVAALEGNDIVNRIKNNWQMIEANPLVIDPSAQYETQQFLNYLDLLEKNIQAIIVSVGYVTIPPRLNDWLEESRPGYYVPFHLVFEDELPGEDDRNRLLKFLTFAPRAIRGGIVDATNGLVYRYNMKAQQRAESVSQVIISLIFLTVLVWIAPNLAIKGWPLAAKDVGTVLVGWLAILVGLLVHLAIAAFKRSRQAGALPPLTALSDLEYQIDARKGQILFKLFLAFIALFMLLFSSDDVSKLNAYIFFLTGYSLDSFLDMFVSSVEQQATAQVEAMKNKLGVK